LVLVLSLGITFLPRSLRSSAQGKGQVERARCRVSMGTRLGGAQPAGGRVNRVKHRVTLGYVVGLAGYAGLERLGHAEESWARERRCRWAATAEMKWAVQERRERKMLDQGGLCEKEMEGEGWAG
jgi:hypothetical protein